MCTAKHVVSLAVLEISFQGITETLGATYKHLFLCLDALKKENFKKNIAYAYILVIRLYLVYTGILINIMKNIG